MVKLKYFFISPFWGKIFNKSSLTKIIIIFVVGFISRILVNDFFDVNVVVDYTNNISLIYYFIMGCFYRLLDVFISYFNFSIFPAFIIDLFKNINNINFEALKLSSIRKAISHYFNFNKINLTNNNSNIDNISSEDNIKIVTSLMKKNIGSSSNISSSGKNVVGSSNAESSSSRVNTNQGNINNQSNLGEDIIVDSDIENSKTPVSFIMGRGSVDGIECIPSIPRVNYNTKPVFNPYNDRTLRQTDSNSLLSTIPDIPDTPKANNLSTPDLDSNSVRFPLFGDDLSVVTPSEICTPRISISQNVENTNNSSNVSTSNFTNDTNHGTVGSVDSNLPHIDMRLNGIRKNMDMISSFEPQNPSDIDLDYRTQQIKYRTEQNLISRRRQLVENAMISNDFVVEDMPVHKKGLKGKLNISFKYLGSEIHKGVNKLDSIYVHYHDVAKRHFFWTIWEKRTGNYNSYEDFKENFDIDTSIFDQIFKRTNVDVSDEIHWSIKRNNQFNRRIGNNNVKRIISESKKR